MVRELGSDRRETGRSLSTAGVWVLRRVVPSKKLLLRGVIRDDKSANNGETFINLSVAAIMKFNGPIVSWYNSLEDWKNIKAIPWEDKFLQKTI